MVPSSSAQKKLSIIYMFQRQYFCKKILEKSMDQFAATPVLRQIDAVAVRLRRDDVVRIATALCVGVVRLGDELLVDAQVAAGLSGAPRHGAVAAELRPRQVLDDGAVVADAARVRLVAVRHLQVRLIGWESL